MLIEEALFSYLSTNAGVSALVSTRIYPMTIPQDKALPAVAYQRVGGLRVLAHDNSAKLAGGRWQFTCQAESYDTAKDVAAAIRAALHGYRGLMGGVSGVQVDGAQAVSEIDGYGMASTVFTVRLDVELLVYREA